MTEPAAGAPQDRADGAPAKMPLVTFVRKVAQLSGPCIERGECQHTVCQYVREARALIEEASRKGRDGDAGHASPELTLKTGPASQQWLRYTQRMLELHFIEDTNFLMAFGRAAGQGAKHPLEALDRVCAAAIKYWDLEARRKR